MHLPARKRRRSWIAKMCWSVVSRPFNRHVTNPETFSFVASQDVLVRGITTHVTNSPITNMFRSVVSRPFLRHARNRRCFCVGVVVFFVVVSTSGPRTPTVRCFARLWWCGGGDVVVFLWWCFLWWCFFGGGVVFLWLCFCGGASSFVDHQDVLSVVSRPFR